MKLIYTMQLVKANQQYKGNANRKMILKKNEQNKKIQIRNESKMTSNNNNNIKKQKTEIKVKLKISTTKIKLNARS